MSQRVENARAYVIGAEIPEPRGARGAGDNADVMAALETTKQQAAVVASEVVAFAPGVSGTFRQDLVNSTLLAQLVAKQKVPDSRQIFDWYDAYFDALANIGWSVAARDFAIWNQQGQDLDVHKAIIAVLATVLGPAVTALAIVTSTLDALQSMEPDSPWITLFSRESQHAEQAHFQVTAVSVGDDGQPFVTLAAFSVQANATTTQVLFFRWRASNAVLRHCSSKVSIDEGVAAAIRGPLRDKVAAHAADFIKALPDLV